MSKTELFNKVNHSKIVDQNTLVFETLIKHIQQQDEKLAQLTDTILKIDGVVTKTEEVTETTLVHQISNFKEQKNLLKEIKKDLNNLTTNGCS